jgi:hypothetical protein
MTDFIRRTISSVTANSPFMNASPKTLSVCFEVCPHTTGINEDASTYKTITHSRVGSNHLDHHLRIGIVRGWQGVKGIRLYEARSQHDGGAKRN